MPCMPPIMPYIPPMPPIPGIPPIIPGIPPIIPGIPFPPMLKSNLSIKCTLHLWRIEITKSFLSLFLLLILINPLAPVYLNVLIFLWIFGQSGPERFGLVSFSKGEEKVESCFGPFWFLLVDLFEEFKVQGIILWITLSLERNGCWSEFDFLVFDVTQLNFHEDGVFSLCPLYDWMTKL